MEKVLIFPYSGTGIEALDCLNSSQQCVGFISDDANLVGTSYQNITIYNREILANKEYKILAVNGSPLSYINRKKIIDGLGVSEDQFTNVIHPSATIGKNVLLGNNVLIMAGCVITSNAIIKNHVCLLPNVVVHHDSIINDYSLIAANVTICGNVVIGSNCYIGASATIKNGLTIGERSLIGMSSAQTKSIDGNQVWAGNPSIFFKNNN